MPLDLDIPPSRMRMGPTDWLSVDCGVGGECGPTADPSHHSKSGRRVRCSHACTPLLRTDRRQRCWSHLTQKLFIETPEQPFGIFHGCKQPLPHTVPCFGTSFLPCELLPPTTSRISYRVLYLQCSTPLTLCMQSLFPYLGGLGICVRQRRRWWHSSHFILSPPQSRFSIELLHSVAAAAAAAAAAG